MSPDFCRIFLLILFKRAQILIILYGHVFCGDADKISIRTETHSKGIMFIPPLALALTAAHFAAGWALTYL